MDSVYYPIYILFIIAMFQIIFTSTMKKYNCRTRRYEPVPLYKRMIYTMLIILWNILLGYFVYYLCKQGMTNYAWLITLAPVFITLFLYFFIAVLLLNF